MNLKLQSWGEQGILNKTHLLKNLLGIYYVPGTILVLET
jgi:hypothetical protein